MGLACPGVDVMEQIGPVLTPVPIRAGLLCWVESSGLLHIADEKVRNLRGISPRLFQ